MDLDQRLPNASQDLQEPQVLLPSLLQDQDQDWSKFSRDSQVLLEHDKAVYLMLG